MILEQLPEMTPEMPSSRLCSAKCKSKETIAKPKKRARRQSRLRIGLLRPPPRLKKKPGRLRRRLRRSKRMPRRLPDRKRWRPPKRLLRKNL